MLRNHSSAVASFCLVFSVFFSIWISLKTAPIQASPLQTNAIPEVEQFALAKDRKAFLDRLVPGSEEDFYYRCLHAQNTGDLDYVFEALPKWRDKWGETPRWITIRNRQAILNYKFQPDVSTQVFRSQLSLHFGHQRQLPTAELRLPTSLDPQQIERTRLVKNLLQANDLSKLTLESLYDHSDFFLASQDQDQIRFLLTQLSKPDYPELVKLIVSELKSSRSGGFGSLPIHNLLTLEQLQACGELHPDLKGNSNWVLQIVQRLQGNPVPLPERYAQRMEEYRQIWKFIRPLPASHNSLKSVVLHELLSLQLKSGAIDRELFLEYLKLPRQRNWVHPLLRQRSAATPSGIADDFANFPGVLLGRISPQPDALVEAGLQLFLREPGAEEDFEPFIEEHFLNRQLATAQVLAGLGDNQRWSAILTPAGYRELVERVDLAFQTEDRTWYAPDESVALQLKVKNVQEIVVRIYQLNALNCYLKLGKTVDANISLEGLVPNHERKLSRMQPPALQTLETLELPELKGRGLFVVDIIGGGKNCRAMINKGRLVHVARTTRYGQEVTVLDEQGKTCQASSVWVGSRRFAADENGRVLVPFSNSTAAENVVLEHQDFAYPAALSRQKEDWSLELAAHCDRESLLPGATAKVLLRPMLKVSGEPIPSDGLLENVQVQLTAINQDNEPAVRTYRNLEVTQQGELALEFLVPPRLKTLSFNLSGEIRVLSQNLTVRLAADRNLAVNGIAATDQIACSHLIRSGQNYFVDVLGRNGERLPNYPVNLELITRWTSEPVRVSMQSNDRGQISLGELTGVVNLAVQMGQHGQQWTLQQQSFQSLPSILSVPANTALSIPVSPHWVRTDIEQPVVVFEVKHGQYLRKLADVAQLKNGKIELQPLAAGEFELMISGQSFALPIWSVEGRMVAGHLVNSLTATEIAPGSLLSIREIKQNEEQLEIQIDGATELTRVHVFATRYVPRFSAGLNLDKFIRRAPTQTTFNWNGNRYVSARQLGDEYLYILNRKATKHLPGSMLTRPSLLMTPWSLGPTDTQNEVLLEDEALSSGQGVDGDPAMKMAAKPSGGADSEIADFASLDFLARGALVLEDLEVGKDGKLKIPRDVLGDKHHLTVVAVDLFSTSQRTMALEPQELQTRDQRIDHALAKDQHFSMKKQAAILKADETFTLDNMLTGKFETVTDLTGVWRFLLANGTDPQLAQFEFLTRWSEIKDEERRKLYDEHAGHEFNFWLYQKDKPFFDNVVRPVLKNRHEPTFVDCWLLERELSEWARPWRMAQLNTFELILLAQRLPAARAGILRGLKEQFEISPPDDVVRTSLFDAQLAAGLLEYQNRSMTRDLTMFEPDQNVPMAPSSEAVPEGRLGGMGGLGMGGMGGGKDRGLAQSPRAQPAQRGGRDRGEAARELDEKSESWVDAKKSKDQLGEVDDKPAFDEFYGFADKEFLQRGREGLGRWQVMPSFYDKLKPTERWIESAWYRIPQTTATQDRIPLNRFWLEYAQKDPQEKFLSASFGLCRANLSDSILALAVLDLPAQAQEGKTEVDGQAIRWTTNSPAIVFHQQIADQALNPGAMMVSENFFDPADRHQLINNRKADKFLSGPFYRGKLYGGQMVVTNPTSTPQSIQVLVQIPAGAIAVNGSQPTRSLSIELGAFASSSHEYWFYFPEAGELDHFPAHAADATGILAHAKPLTLTVLAERGQASEETWEHISQNGSIKQVLAWLDQANLKQIDLAMIAFRMKDRKVFEQVLEHLSNNMVYHRTLWSYAVEHRDFNRLGEFLEHETAFIETCRPALESELITIRPETRRWYEHVEFWPLVNSRAHQVGSQRRILNNQLFQQYVELLNILSCRRELDSDDCLALVCYLLAQDRFEEALEWFARVKRDEVAGKLQYDYAAAYLAMLQAKPDQAETIAKQYAQAEPKRWRERFAAISAQVAELKGEPHDLVDEADLRGKAEKMMADAATFEAELDGGKLRVSYRNLDQLVFNYYPIDVELMFSRDPFGDQSQASQAMISPTLSETVVMEAPGKALVHQVPPALTSQNLLIEIRHGETIRTLRRLANRLDLQVAPSMAHLQVRNAQTDAPLAATYVKVYARRNNGQVVFWKDGYTDLRGKFDYASQSVQPLEGVVEFAILLMDDHEGCVTKTVKAPQQ